MRLPCPHCGLRDLEEFYYGGPALPVRPADPEAVDDRGWAEYLFYRQNPKGPHQEVWQHRYGCRAWFELRRDTLSHEVLNPAETDGSS